MTDKIAEKGKNTQSSFTCIILLSIQHGHMDVFEIVIRLLYATPTNIKYTVLHLLIYLCVC